MPYSELVKNLDHIRRYMRDFYVYGFKSREDYDRQDGAKSLRSYDDERRRLESWLGSYMGFRRTAEGKNAFISIDPREVSHNPLYNAWKAKSFTSGDITLHFILMDILADAKQPLSLAEITQKIDADYLSLFEPPLLPDESTVRKKLKEYADEGMVSIAKDGKRSVYSLYDGYADGIDREALHFFSEVAPCGVIGSFLLDSVQNAEQSRDILAFKHHYITGALDSDIMCRLLDAMSKRAHAELVTVSRANRTPRTSMVVPLRIFVSAQNGRQHLMAWCVRERRIKSYRLDYILSVKVTDACQAFDDYRRQLEEKKPYMWGVMLRQDNKNLQHIEFTVTAKHSEPYILRRLLREKRCGRVEQTGDNTYRFTADVFDINEMIPWVRTFICRIVDIRMSDKATEDKFKHDIQAMYAMYGIGGDDGAVQ